MKIGKKELAIGAGLGLLYYFFWPKEAKAAVVSVLPQGDFETVQGLKFWTRASLPRVRQMLVSHGIQTFGRPDLPQSAVMTDGAPSGGDNALNWVVVKQLKGWFVGTSDDLLHPTAGLPINIVAAAQDVATAKLAFGGQDSTWAVLPPLAEK